MFADDCSNPSNYHTCPANPSGQRARRGGQFTLDTVGQADSFNAFCKRITSLVRKINLSDFRVATSETARDINRRIVLNLIRKHQPVSRAELSRHSGLQRSTVSVIAEQLIAVFEDL